MRSVFQALVVMGIAALFSASGAKAGVPIPCTGETIVKVLDLDTADLAAAQAQKTGKPPRKIDLGYKFSGCFSGKWVGYTGSSRSYLDLPEDMLRLLLMKSGRKDFPPAPSFMGTFSASWVVWMYLVVFGILGISVFFQSKQTSSAEGTGSPVPVAPAANGGAVAAGLIGSARPASAPVPAAPALKSSVPAAARRPVLGPVATAAAGPRVRASGIVQRSGGFGRRA